MTSQIVYLLLNLHYLVISIALGLNYSQPCGISLLVPYKASRDEAFDLNHPTIEDDGDHLPHIRDALLNAVAL